MITPNNRKDFERHLNLLADRASTGNLSLVPDRKLISGLLSAKYAPNGRMNFLTIDESTRALANSIARFERPAFKNNQDAE